MAVIITKEAKRDYSIQGSGPASKSVETRHVRSATLQSVRDTINEEWEVSEESKVIKIITTVRIIALPGGVRRVVSESQRRPSWMEDIENGDK